MSEKVVFHNPISGETLVHRERADGVRDLFYGPTGDQDHGHAVLDQLGTPRYIRDLNRRVIADDKLG